ncbi:F0F1 ATP synthase subunit delta [Varunaivibrio sulfuroxidans]|uniref:ATP synthase subunit delta n=1 Tax=Varunaivibrio sulfuroxidans TaxID=1773489 RepID=A0A4R3JCU6_9PROT|nr:F0F1 ATP synthase subunit delta [Varunaivibrio sulfuroxidans]TCS63592.1 ATP synthase F1 subcomplex delta subunit [Varunaivibrio sulfuroxidans]WES30265.1 F0F1 ATP synthase subunit delta [Varunaivibrio sulfuroxidans]
MSSETTGATGLAARYAAALFDLAKQAEKLDAVADDMRSLLAMIDDSADLRRLISSPVIARADQRSAISALLEKAGADDLVRRFVIIVVENRRLAILAAAARAFLSQLSESRGEVRALVTSAKELSDKQRQAIAGALKKVTGADVSVQSHVDGDLLGGLIVKIGSRMVDTSLRTKLQQMRLSMKGVG